MKAMNELRKRKAISPVIATVILVAVAITIAVAVSYWMAGIAGQYTKFEKVEIQAASCEKLTGTVPGTGYWKITLTLKNSGSATSTLNGVYVDDMVAELITMTVPPVTTPPTLPTPIDIDTTCKRVYADVSLLHTKSINSGQTETVYVYVGTKWPETAPLTSGTTIDIKLHSANGMDYIKLIGLV